MCYLLIIVYLLEGTQRTGLGLYYSTVLVFLTEKKSADQVLVVLCQCC